MKRRERQVGVVVDELDLDRHADGHVRRFDADDVGHEARALFERDEPYNERIVERRDLRVMVHHEAVYRAATACLRRVPFVGAAVVVGLLITAWRLILR